MSLSRRSLLQALPGLAAGTALLLPPGARADTDPRMAPRAVGSPNAPARVTEWFSLTCPHCARFAHDTYPKVKAQLIDPGKLYYQFGDFPLDRVALTAAMVARALPPERYEPFILALLASQDRWAFARDVNNTEEIWKFAALAGMSRPTFEATIKDDKLRDAILAEQEQAEKQYHVDSTPTFIFSGPAQQDRRESGEMSYDVFAKVVSDVTGTSG
jgi:protein-disulfide isomerase